MVKNFTTGQLVRVKNLAEIEKTLTDTTPNNVSIKNQIHFNYDMDCHCHGVFEITQVVQEYGVIKHVSLKTPNSSHTYDDVIEWIWDVDWIEPVIKRVELPEELFNV